MIVVTAGVEEKQVNLLNISFFFCGGVVDSWFPLALPYPISNSYTFLGLNSQPCFMAFSRPLKSNQWSCSELREGSTGLMKAKREPAEGKNDFNDRIEAGLGYLNTVKVIKSIYASQN